MQLVVGLGIIAAIDLRHAGETGLDLQAQREFRQFLFVFGCDFGALRAGADKAHITFEDVYELGQLVDTGGADESADRRYAAVVLAGEPCHAVFFGVDIHASEFQYREYAPVLSKTLLTVEHGAAVIEFDRQRCRQHEGAQANDADRGYYYVKQTLYTEVDCLCLSALHAHHGLAEHGHMLRTGHYDLAQAGHKITANIVLHAVFYEHAAHGIVHSGNEQHLYAVKLCKQFARVGAGMADGFYKVEMLGEIADRLYPRQIRFGFMDDGGLWRWE